MSQHLQFASKPADDSFLQVAELLHRIRNDYARVISFASQVATRSSSQETKSALGEVINHLHTTAETLRVLRPPLAEGLVDFADNLTRLCRVVTTSFKTEYRGIALLLSVPEPVLLDAVRCWRASLIVFELIDNASRHAFGSRGGRITVTVAATSERNACQVNDDGPSALTFKPGFGAHLVDALAAELDGFVARQLNENGTTATLSFPRQSPDLAPQLQSTGGWGDGGEALQ
jgi:two-component sensor histidine kinase